MSVDGALSPQVFDEVFARISEAPQLNELLTGRLALSPGRSRWSRARALIASWRSCGSGRVITS